MINNFILDITRFRLSTNWAQLARLLRLVLALLSCSSSTYMLLGQARPSATRAGDLQVGALFNLAAPDYGSRMLRGIGAYTTFDFRPHWGIEGTFHQLNDPLGEQGIYERTFEVGPRYVLRLGPLSPYAKLMIGRGVFQFPPDPRHPENGSVANLAYNIWAGGFGTDYSLRSSINLRVDYELQRWSGYPPHGLSPQVFSIGIAYHFH